MGEDFIQYRSDDGVDDEEVSRKEEDGADDNSCGRSDLWPGWPGNTAHLGLNFLKIRPCLFRPIAYFAQFHTLLKILMKCKSYNRRAQRRETRVCLAGAEGFEPPKAVLETAGLPLAYAPIVNAIPDYQNSQPLSKWLRTIAATRVLLSFAMRLMLSAVWAELLHFKPFCGCSLVLGLTVVPIFAFAALELNNFTSHIRLLLLTSRNGKSYETISVTVPAPTVRPPSRIAKRSPLSMATGVISSISSDTLSPGITISMPSGSFATPVTSVVRK